MDKINIGLIGCGTMGMITVNQLLAIDPKLQIFGIYDPDPNSVKNVLEQVQPNPKVYESYQQLLDQPEIDWVMIASWNCFHYEQVIAALKAGKHIFCQKPIAINLKECEEIYEVWKKSNKLFNVAFTLRYSPHYRKIKQLLTEKIIGDIISMEFNETLDFNHGGYIMGNWRRLTKNAGTHLLEKCCHDIDLVNWMVGSKASRVASFGGLNFFKSENEFHVKRIGKNKNNEDAYSTFNGDITLNSFTADKDIIDNQVAIIEFDNNVRATFHTNCNAGIPERRMYILGTEGAIRADVLTGKIEIKKIGFDTVIEDVSTNASGGHGDGDSVLTAELAESMLNGTPPKVGFNEGALSAATCFAIDDAMNEGKVIDALSYFKNFDF